jgi:hypothetical protein
MHLLYFTNEEREREREREREIDTNKQGCTSYDMYTSRMIMHGPMSFHIFD